MIQDMHLQWGTQKMASLKKYTKTGIDKVLIIGAFFIIGFAMIGIAMWGDPILYENLDFHQKLCKHFNDCNSDLEVKMDSIDNPMIYFAMVFIPAMGGFMIYLGMEASGVVKK